MVRTLLRKGHSVTVFDKNPEALEKIRQTPPIRRLVTLSINDPNAVVTGNEPIFDKGTLIGQITSGGYGYSVGKPIAFGYLPPAYTQPGTALEVEYLAQRYAAVVEGDAVFDPQNKRMKS